MNNMIVYKRHDVFQSHYTCSTIKRYTLIRIEIIIKAILRDMLTSASSIYILPTNFHCLHESIEH